MYSADLAVKPVGARSPAHYVAEGETDAQAVEAVRELAGPALAVSSTRDTVLTVSREGSPQPLYITTLAGYDAARGAA